jgi:hypothetical protein
MRGISTEGQSMPVFLPEILFAQFSNGMFTKDTPAGYTVQDSPRRAARGRKGETLFSALALFSQTSMPAAEPDRLARLMSQVFFGTAGSVTAALRAAFVAANAEVLPFSQAPGLTGSPPESLVHLHAVCAVLRDGELYLGYAGNILALILGEGGVESFPAAGDSPARALGATLNVDLRYGHTVLSAASTMILAASPAKAWTSAVPSGVSNLPLQAIGERMAKQSASQAGSFGGLLVRFAPEGAPVKAAPQIGKFSLFGRKKDTPEVPRSAARRPSAPFVLRRRAPAQDSEAGRQKDSSLSQSPALEGPPSLPSDIPASREVSARPLSVSRERDGTASGRPPLRRNIPRAEPVRDSGLHPVSEEPSGVATPVSSPAERTGRRATPIADRRTGGSARPAISARDALSAFARSINVTLSSGLDSLRAFLAGILPRGVLQENDRFSLPPSVLLGTAIAIPLIIVAVVAVMYFRKGYAMEFTRLMQEARTQASVADAQTDPLLAREAWQETFDLLQTAVKYGTSTELANLQSHAVRMLDSFDGITPLEFQPAVAGGLEEGTQITVLLAGDRELYALDGTHDRVLRLLLGQGGYRLDETFLCQSGEYPEITVGSLVDMVWIPGLSIGTQSPPSPRSGAVVAMDNEGTLLYCPPGGKAMAGKLVRPYNGWSTPSSIDYYNGRLYVLDPENNGFWRYAMSDSDGFDQSPSAYFSAAHPSVADAIDFVVASGEVFFLHADGHITQCQYDPLFQPEDSDSTGGTLCQSIPYNDTRPGRTAGPRIEDALLNRICYNDPPEPTLFFLDPLGRGVFRFSLALNFISRYRVTIAPEGHEATALAVGADKVLYIAIGNQIYYALTRTP